ncbi:cytochrome b/b6 domain-containing protein [Sulfurirhabdus autotrophica]|uniref:Cytochrome b n=1 Tax=Sulfurirhabdus autotrophica TaxID=1706046 RepID=A0A4R3Y6D5_9PROT|nr:cytochrome b/b6 domain-containing protein [Sulfurirhabdus autotrophica]TCV87386.1 cytochrome b [Sulfurirhabdus autotrophica]
MIPESQIVERIYVWDIFVRLFHWGLVGLIASNLFFLEEGDDLHRWAGYAAGLAITARLVWGVSISGYARIGAFFPTRQRIRRYLNCYAKHGRCATVGLNPLGAIMAIAMVMLVLFLVLTGWLMGTDVYWGEEWLESLHGVLSYALMVFIALHIFMVFIISYRTKINLPKAMVTGSKERTANSAPFQR